MKGFLLNRTDAAPSLRSSQESDLRFTLAAIAAISLAFTACGNKPAAGDDCKADAAVCSSKTVALFCEGGSYREVLCKGAAGCNVSDEGVTCHVKAAAGDACMASQDEVGQCDSENANKALVCTAGKWTAQDCSSCAVEVGFVVCDQ